MPTPLLIPPVILAILASPEKRQRFRDNVGIASENEQIRTFYRLMIQRNKEEQNDTTAGSLEKENL